MASPAIADVKSCNLSAHAAVDHCTSLQYASREKNIPGEGKNTSVAGENVLAARENGIVGFENFFSRSEKPKKMFFVVSVCVRVVFARGVVFTLSAMNGR